MFLDSHRSERENPEYGEHLDSHRLSSYRDKTLLGNINIVSDKFERFYKGF